MSSDIPAGDEQSSSDKGGGDPAACERCATPLELLTVLPRTGDHPAFRIFGCAACSFVLWIAEKIAE